MNLKEKKDKFSQIQKRLLNNLLKKFRPIYLKIEFNSRGNLLYGPRGVGKTTLMLYKINAEEDSFFFSADNPLIADTQLYDFVDFIIMQGYKKIYIDEINHIDKWSENLKALYDSFPEIKFIISDSSSILLRKGLGDLSRRFIQIHLPLLSTREYLCLKYDKEFPIINPFSINNEEIKTINNGINIMKEFKVYLKEGFRPIFLEGNYEERLINIFEKTIYKDIPFFVPQINEKHLRFMKAVIGGLATSKIPKINVSSLCNKWEISKRKLYQLLYVMENIGLIRIIRKRDDEKINSTGSKIFLENPSIYPLFNGEIGNIRESFVYSMFEESGIAVHASENEEEYDFLIDDKKLEIGGRNKNIKEADYIIKDNIDIPYNKTIPLWVLGFMY